MNQCCSALEISKIGDHWNDAENQDGVRPESITVRLWGDGAIVETRTVTPDAEGNWSRSFTNLPKYNNGVEIAYNVTEDIVPDYSTTYEGYNIINEHTPDQTSLTVLKIWDDADNQDGYRPENITVTLLANGQDTGKTLLLDEANNWQGSFTGLDVNTPVGEPIEYTIEEISVDEYATVITGDGTTGYVITNEHIPELININGSKYWHDEDDQDGIRPSYITIHLFADDTEVDSMIVVPDVDGNMSWSFNDLPKYADGKEITYTVTEDAVEGYDTDITITKDEETGNYTVTIDNSHIPETLDIEGIKTWDDNDDEKGIRPDRIIVRLFADGDEIKDITVTAEDDWAWSFTDLPKYRDGGIEIQYTVTEDTVDDYLTEITVNAEDVYEITNKIIQPTISKEIHEDDYERKEEEDADMHEGEDTSGEGWGSWDDADNAEEVTFHLKVEDLEGVTNLTVHDYLEEGFDFERNSVEVILTDGKAETEWHEGTEYEVHEGTCSDPECAMEGCTFEIAFEDEDFEDISSDEYLMITYKALTDTSEEDYEDYEDDIWNYAYMTYGINLLRSAVTYAETDLFGFEVYKYAVNIKGEEEAEVSLENAQFILSRDGQYAVFEGEEVEEPETEETEPGTEETEPGTEETEPQTTETGESNESEDDESAPIYLDDEGSEPTDPGTTDPEDPGTADPDDPGTEEPEPEEPEINTYIVSGWVDNPDDAGIMSTSHDGLIMIEGLDDDTYELTEVKAPTGYVNYVEESIKLVIDEYGNVTVEGDTGRKESVTDDHVINVENTRELTEISGEKIWDDADDQDSVRPEKITVYLLADGEPARYEDGTEVASLDVYPDEEGSWTWTFTELPKYNVSDKDNVYEIVYTFEEDAVEGYERIPAEDELTVINRHIPETADITVDKTWEDADDIYGIRPAYIIIHLLADGEPVLDEYGEEITAEIVPDEEGSWTYTFTDLPKYKDGGTLIAYTVEEDEVDDYATSIEQPDEENGYKATVTNTTQKKSVDTNGDGEYDNDGEAVKVGQILDYQITYVNPEDKEATVTITDTLDPNLEYVVPEEDDDSYDPVPEVVESESTDEEGNTVITTTLVWTIEAAANETGSVKFQAKVLEGAKKTGQVENEATVQIGDHVMKTNKVHNPTDDDEFTEPEKTVDVGDGTKVTIGEELTYTITYYNNHSEAADVVIEDRLDDNVEFRKASDDGIYDAENHTVTWTIRDVDPYTEGSVSVRVRVLEGAAEVDQIENTATVKIGNDEAVKTNTVKNPLDEEPTPTPEPTHDDEPREPKKYVDVDGDGDFADNKEEVKAGDELTYKITYYNNHASYDVVTITDKLDSNLEYVEGSASDDGVYNATKRTITWSVGAAAFTEGSVTFKVKVLSEDESAEKVTNKATVQIGVDTPQETNEVENPMETTSGGSNPTGGTTGTGSTPSSTTTPTSSSGSGGTGSSGGATSTVKTVDETPVGPMAGLMLAALAVMLAAFTYRRRRTSNK